MEDPEKEMELLKAQEENSMGELSDMFPKAGDGQNPDQGGDE